MKLLLDVGNTALKWGCYASGRLDPTGHFVHRGGDIAALAGRAWGGLGAPEEVLIANVAGDATGRALADWLAAHWGVRPVFLRSVAAACGVSNAYRVPQELGIDRWAAVVAAHHGHADAVCVVDCGTAITLDLVTADGEHRGGLILPGIGDMQQMLLHNTAGLRLQGERPVAVPLANATAAGIESGAVYLVVAAIERILADMGAELGERITCVMTGGDAGRVMPLLHESVQHDPDLVLKGIALLGGECR